jgi:hypothetical protein
VEMGLPQRPAVRRFDGTLLRMILTLMILIASVSLLTGTAASLNATTINPASSFATGTLILSNQVDNRNPCVSTGAKVACDALFPGVHGPGVTATARVTIKNAGTVPVATLTLWSSGCQSSGTAGRSGADLCPSTWLTIHDDGHDRCYFPVQAAGSCGTAVHGTYADFVSQHGEANPIILSTDQLGSGIAYTLTATIDPAAGNDLQNRVADMTVFWGVTQA